MTKKEIEREAEFLRGYARPTTAVKNFGGNFWGKSRSRCMIMDADRIRALAEAGVITMHGSATFYVNPESGEPFIRRMK